MEIEITNETLNVTKFNHNNQVIATAGEDGKV